MTRRSRSRPSRPHQPGSRLCRLNPKRSQRHRFSRWSRRASVMTTTMRAARPPRCRTHPPLRQPTGRPTLSLRWFAPSLRHLKRRAPRTSPRRPKSRMARRLLAPSLKPKRRRRPHQQRPPFPPRSLSRALSTRSKLPSRPSRQQPRSGRMRRPNGQVRRPAAWWERGRRRQRTRASCRCSTTPSGRLPVTPRGPHRGGPRRNPRPSGEGPTTERQAALGLGLSGVTFAPLSVASGAPGWP